MNDGYDDGKVLIAGVLYDEETLGLPPDDCEHAGTEIEERIGGIPFGYCYDCQSTVQQTGLDDEDGNPGWELCE